MGKARGTSPHLKGSKIIAIQEGFATLDAEERARSPVYDAFCRIIDKGDPQMLRTFKGLVLEAKNALQEKRNQGRV